MTHGIFYLPLRRWLPRAPARLLIVLAAMGLWGASLGARLIYLQLAENGRGARSFWQERQQTEAPRRRRGTIFDARGRELAVSEDVESLYAVPREVPNARVEARVLSGILNQPEDQLAGLLRKNWGFVWLARQMDPAVSATVRNLGLRGLHFIPERRRVYPNGALAGQVLGMTGLDRHGLSGIELIYDKFLSGFSGAEEGHDLRLTIDAVTQYLVERELAAAIEKLRARWATAIVLDPRSGAILAMATAPAFDPNNFATNGHSKLSPANFRNRSIQDAYEPGSVFILLSGATAVQSGLVTPTDPFDISPMALAGISFYSHQRGTIVPFGEALAAGSSIADIAAIRAALIIGNERLYRNIAALGFGAPTGIDLPGESSGILHPAERWGPLSKVYAARGMGLAVTPLQLACAFAALANGGVLRRPFLVLDSSVIQRRRASQPYSARTSTAMLPTFSRLPLADAGKTRVAVLAKGGRSDSVEWQIGFYPSHSPQLLLLLSIFKGTTERHPIPAGLSASIGRAAFLSAFGELLRYYRIPAETGGRDGPAIPAASGP